MKNYAASGVVDASSFLVVVRLLLCSYYLEKYSQFLRHKIINNLQSPKCFLKCSNIIDSFQIISLQIHMFILLLFFFVSLLVAADVLWSVLWTWTAAGSTESSPSESECQLRVGGKGTWWYLHNSKNFVSRCHCSNTLKKMDGGVICTVTARAGWADVLIDTVQI